MKYLLITLAIIASGGISLLILSSSENPVKTSDKKEGTETDISALPQRIASANINKTYSFAGELLPMEDFDVRERLDKELTVNSYYHSSTLILLKRSRRYFDIIDPILRENGIPSDFKYLAVAESALSNATSPAGAKGFWQFMKTTGRAYGLEINSAIDERFHLEKATRAACKLIKNYKERFGTWSLAALAYNGGETRIARSLRQQRAEYFYQLNLNTETMRYLFRIVALKEIMSQPSRYGYEIEEKDYYPDLPLYETLTVDTTIADLGAFCEKQEISYRKFKVYNPWILNSHLPNASRRTYKLKIPFSDLLSSNSEEFQTD
ncbi:MAG: transglycosylase SLT domain-containing protein [Bacteroidetes bacterium]|nr:transglycosylase SLT domain-containing protein [Bacteroidota bacterium]